MEFEIKKTYENREVEQESEDLTGRDYVPSASVERYFWQLAEGGEVFFRSQNLPSKRKCEMEIELMKARGSEFPGMPVQDFTGDD